MQTQRRIVRGVVVSKLGEPAAGVFVAADDAPNVVARTARDGTFVLPAEGKTLVARDHRKREIGKASVEDGRIVIDSVEPRARPVLEPHVMACIVDAIDTIEPERRTRARLAFDALSCGLPPVLRTPELVDIARGVLLGRPEDFADLRDVVSQFEAWNAQRHPAPALSQDDAEKMLRAALVQKKADKKHRHSHDGVISREALGLLVMSVALIAGRDPLRIARSFQALHGQLHAVRQLRSLVRTARRAFDGDPSAFERTLLFFGGFCPGDFRPGGLPFPFPPPDRWDVPQPDPGGGFLDECEDIYLDGLRAVVNAMRPRIDEISPANPCPGDTLTIVGDHFIYEGFNAFVVFPAGRGREILVAPSTVSDTRIEVTVPEGATCGTLKLGVTVAESQLVCDIEQDYFVMSWGGVEFEGGATTINSFRKLGSWCVHAGDRVVFDIRVCNARRLELTITTRELGADVSHTDAFVLDAGTRTFTWSPPRFERNAGVRATLVAEGCGRDERIMAFGIQRPPREDLAPLAGTEFENWHRNVRRSAVVSTPTTLDELVDAVRTAERLNLRLGVRGTAWSYTDCIVPRRTTHAYVDTDRLRGDLPPVLRVARRTGVESVLDNVTRQATGVRPVEELLVHVHAGTKLWDLNCQLDRMELAIPNLGGANGQSIAGTVNTSTHGAQCNMPPIPDLVRAIHLVGNGGQQWWIEPSEMRVTDETRMRELMAEGVLDPCLELHYDNRLFAAALVAMGGAGIVYSYILETVPAHELFERTRLVNWESGPSSAKEIIRAEVLNARRMPWYFEVSLNPTRSTWITTRNPPTPDEREEFDRAHPEPGEPHGLDSQHLHFLLFGPTSGLIVGFGSGLIATVMAGLSAYFVRRTAEIPLILATQPWRAAELAEEVRLIEDLTNTVTELIRVFNELAHGPSGELDEALARLMPPLLNALWRIGFFFVAGRELVDSIQNLFTSIDQRPPGVALGPSYQIFTEQETCSWSPEHDENPGEMSPLEKLIHSQEYIVRPDELIAFTDAVLDAADVIRRGDDRALILILNLRFTQSTRASLGMQQWPTSAYCEIWTVAGMRGNADFYAAVERIVECFEAIPHWGHAHRATNLTHLYERHDEWRTQIDRIATRAGRPNTFRGQFLLARGLVEES